MMLQSFKGMQSMIENQGWSLMNLEKNLSITMKSCSLKLSQLPNSKYFEKSELWEVSTKATESVII